MAELWPGGPIVLPHEFHLDDHRIVLPEIPTHTLLSWLAMGAWWELFPGSVDTASLAPFIRPWLDDDDAFDRENLHDPAVVIFGRLGGMATLDGLQDGWWPARRLATTALNDWPNYCAWCATHGIDPLAGPLHQVMGAIYGWLRDRVGGPVEYDKLDQQIYGPPPNQPALEAALPRAVRDQEAALAIATLREMLPGEQITPEWTGA